MPTPAAIFREIHRLRRYIRELDGRTDQGPRLRKAQEDKLIHQKEVSIRSTQDQIKKYEKQLRELNSNKKEYDALTAEIAQAKAAISRLEDETLDLMAKSEEQAAKLPELETALKKAKDDYARFDHDFAANLQRYADEKTRAQAELQAQEAALPDDFRPLYNRGVAAKGADALSGVQNGVCSACYTEVTPQMASELRRGSFLMCKSCGRILYAE